MGLQRVRYSWVTEYTHIHTHISQSVSCSVVSNSLWPHRLQHARPPCPSPTPGAYSNSCPPSWWCHPTISSSVAHFSSRLQSSPASGFFLVSQHTHIHTHTNTVPGTTLKPLSASPHHLSQKSREWVMLTTFYRCGNWELESWSDSGKVTQWGRSSIRFQGRSVWIWSLQGWPLSSQPRWEVVRLSKSAASVAWGLSPELP